MLAGLSSPVCAASEDSHRLSAELTLIGKNRIRNDPANALRPFLFMLIDVSVVLWMCVDSLNKLSCHLPPSRIVIPFRWPIVTSPPTPQDDPIGVLPRSVQFKPPVIGG